MIADNGFQACWNGEQWNVWLEMKEEEQKSAHRSGVGLFVSWDSRFIHFLWISQ